MGDVLSGITDTLFGSAPETSNEQVSKLTPEQSGLLTTLINQIKGQVGKGVSPYPETESSLQSSAFDIVNQIIKGEGNIGKNYGAGQEALSGFLEPYSDQEAKDYWSKAVYDPAMQSFQGTLGKLLEPYIASGAGESSAAKRAMTKAGSDLATNLAASKASTLYNDRNQYNTNKMAAINDIINYTTLPFNMATKAGETQYSQGLNSWLQSQPYNNPWLQYISPALSPPAFDTVVNQTGGTPGMINNLLPVAGSFFGSDSGSDLLSGWLGGGSSGDGIGDTLKSVATNPATWETLMTFMSDKRLKKEIEYLN
jgi:hypothetical protein